MLNELIDELKLALKKKARENDFYEVIQICSYKEIPDIDVEMLTSFIGIIAFEHLGFIATNIIFQSVPGLLFWFFFYYFSFHTGKELEENYLLAEIFILISAYIIGFILVGGSSTISLKQINKIIKIMENNNDSIYDTVINFFIFYFHVFLVF